MSENSVRLPDEKALIVSSSPHYHTQHTIAQIMMWVVIALMPAAAAGVYYFGLPALRVLAVCTLGSILFEGFCSKVMRRPLEIGDYSAAVTGLLLGMNLPASTPTWICLMGVIFAIGIGKMVFGGIGCNPFNPALVGRVALLIAFPAAMTTWPLPRGAATIDALTGPTPLHYLADLQSSGAMQTLSSHVRTWDLFIGRTGGSLGETCAVAILAGGLLLIVLNIIRWHIPLFYLLTVALITGIPWLAAPGHYASPIVHLLSGGLMLGAFFMATDMVTSPLSRTGAILFAIGCGVITSVIRLWGSYPEGVSFSILIMNALTPLLDSWTAGKPFGAPKKKGIKL